jgi:hypothetical protein
VKTALATTTIHVPKVLELYRAHDPDVMFFVAGDLKTPPEAKEFCEELGNCVYIDAEQNYAHAVHIGDNTDSKRNFALLEAMRWKADVIISVDDDMVPHEENFFGVFKRACDPDPFWGLQLGFEDHWFDAGRYTNPPARQRGLPTDGKFSSGVLRHVHDVQIGAAQGIILGVPDTDACTAFDTKPFVLGATDFLRAGFVVDQRANAVFNSQLTAFRAELAPAFAQFYFAQGRNTDIFSSLLMRRIMREKNLYTYFGPPAAIHARQPRPLLKDLQAERYGVDNIVRYAEYLNRAPLPKDISVVEQCRILAQGWNGPELEAALAFYDDVESILK